MSMHWWYAKSYFTLCNEYVSLTVAFWIVISPNYLRLISKLHLVKSVAEKICTLQYHEKFKVFSVFSQGLERVELHNSTDAMIALIEA